MTPGPFRPGPTPWSADRQPRWLAAGALATALVVLGFAFVPVAWLRDLFGRDFRVESVLVPTGIEVVDGIRLIPAPRAAGGETVTDVRPRVERPEPVVEPTAAPEPTGTSDFTWDPTTPYSVRASLLRPAPLDSVTARVILTRALAQGGPELALAYLDTTQVGAAHRRFAWMDAYMNQVLGPLLRAQGQAARNAEIFRRAVVEGEQEGH